MAVTIEQANKCAQELMKFIDEELLSRLKNGISKRMFKTSLFYMAEEPVHANRLKVSIMSLFQGNEPSYSPLTASSIDMSYDDNSDILRNYQNCYIYSGSSNCDTLTLLSRPYSNSVVGINTYLTAREVSLLAGLPQKEVPGISLKQSVPFGLNEKSINKENGLKLGCMIQKGRVLPKIEYYLDRKSINKHIFIAGVTGGGKTTTCHRLLSEICQDGKTSFMVIEPAKTEYRTLIRDKKHFKNLVVFTIGNEDAAPFRLNPFELVEGELITGHIDMLKATFTSAFPMEASMPQLLEEAMYSCYEAMGWDVETNRNERFENPYAPNVDAFPQLSDLLKAMSKVVDSKGFGKELQQNYVGSLVSRLSNLTKGSKGMILNCPHSVDFEYLMKHNVILEMEEIRSPEEKSLIMGLILSRMSAVIKKLHQSDNSFTHVTLVEEAHRLLSKVEYGDSGSKKVAVETFADMLAEVRKYGESLVIVDQIPNKLSSEVLKNTNTKIIHRILARDDKEVVGDTMLMDDRQKEYLSVLSVGDAVVFSENTDSPVNIHIDPISDTNEKQIPNGEVEDRFKAEKNHLGTCYKMPYISLYVNRYIKLSEKINKNATKIKKEQTGEVDKEYPWKVSDITNFINKVKDEFSSDYEYILKEIIRRKDILLGDRYLRYMEDYDKYSDRVEKIAAFLMNCDTLNEDAVVNFRENNRIKF